MDEVVLKIVNVMASSLDGRIGSEQIEGDSSRQESGLSSDADYLRLTQEMNAADAIIVGASSIRANRCCLDHLDTLKTDRPQYPHWYILANTPIPTDYEFWKQSQIPRTIISRHGFATSHPVESGVAEIVYGEEDVASFVYRQMQEKEYKRVLLFGGGVINSWFYEKQLVDELKLTIAPMFIAQSHAPYLVSPELKKAVHFKLLKQEEQDGYLFLHYQVLSSPK